MHGVALVIFATLYFVSRLILIGMAVAIGYLLFKGLKK